ncbi:MAG: hypothetical protein C0392_06010 [Syntrophus sp. (in: bacteria)]|nr:hypothetical protein [Syntrophus sp. (in: bacteria)]
MAACVTFILLFCIVGTGFGAQYKPEYKMSVVVGPIGAWGEGASRFAEAVNKATNGRINIKPYYSGQLFAGKQTNEFLLIKQGVIDFSLSSTINWSTTIKELNLFSLPFLFPDYQTLDAVEYGEVGKRLFRAIDENGVTGLAWGENGYRDLTNNKRPVNKPEDLQGLKVRVVGSPIFIDIFKAMGANPVSMNWGEALSAFQQGTVDGQENPVDSIIIPYKLWQVHKYLTVWNYAIDPLIFSVSRSVWQTFTRKDREAILKAAGMTAQWQKKTARAGLSGAMPAFETLKKNGMEVTVLTPEQIRAFAIRTRPVYIKWAKEIGADLVDLTEKEVEKSLKQK